MCNITTPELRTLLLDSVDRVTALSGMTTTGGRLNVRRMVQGCPRAIVTGLTLTSDLASPQPLGKTVTWTAVADGGQGPFTYRWMVETSPDVWVSSPWGTSNTFTWTPTEVNASYRVLVGVRSAWNTGTADLTAVKPYSIQPPVTSATLTSSLAAPQSVGTTVTWTASAAGGQAPYEYQFTMWDGAVWRVMRPWAAGNTYAWTPTAADPDYKVVVQVRSAWNDGASEYAVGKVFPIVLPSVTAATLTPNLSSPRPDGTTVRWQATASGGQPPYQYRFVLFDGNAWTYLTDWTTSNTFEWTPFGPSDRYQVAVRVRSAWNTGGAAEFTTLQNYVISRVALTTAKVVFEPAAPGEMVDYYRFEVFAAGADPNVATPIATQNLGRPSAVCSECSADVVSTLLPLPQGYYSATVAAVRAGGTYRSEPFRFIR